MKKLILIISLCTTAFAYGQNDVQVDELILLYSTKLTTELDNTPGNSGDLIYNVENKSLYVYNGTTNSWEIHRFFGDNTKLKGNNVMVTGKGTIAEPYEVSIKATLTKNLDGSYTFSNGIDPDSVFTPLNVE